MPDLLSPSYSPLMATSPADVVELSLLLPAEQAAEMESVAFQRGLTAGEMVRRLVRDFLTVQRTGSSPSASLLRNRMRSLDDL